MFWRIHNENLEYIVANKSLVLQPRSIADIPMTIFHYNPYQKRVSDKPRQDTEVCQQIPKYLASYLWPRASITSFYNETTITFELDCSSDGLQFVLEWMLNSIRAGAWQAIDIEGRRDQMLPDIKEAAEALGVDKMVEMLDKETVRERC